MCKDCGCSIGNKFAQTNLPTLRLNIEMPGMRNKKSVEAQKIIQPTEYSHIDNINLAAEKKRVLQIELDILAKNDQIALKNRQWFKTNKMSVLNLISSPGSGKTLLLEKTVKILNHSIRTVILNGDQEQDFDAQRLLAAGAQVKQLNTISSCHLDAQMISKELDSFVDSECQILIIENVGNLVCPAAFDLGENGKVALLSCTEGEDKPSKYPLLFREASVIVLTKMDLVPHLDWDLELCLQHIRKVNPHAKIIQLSAKTGEGMTEWVEYLKQTCAELS